MPVRQSNIYERVFLRLSMSLHAEDNAMAKELGARYEEDRKRSRRVADALQGVVDAIGDDDGLWFREAVDALKEAGKP